MNRIVRLQAERVKVSIFANVVQRRVREEDKLWCVVRTGRVPQSAVPIEKTQEKPRCSSHIRRVTTPRVFGPGELVPPAEVHEAVDVALVVIELTVAGRIERNLEFRLREIPLEIDHIVQARGERNLPESEPIFAMIVKILNLVRSWIEDHRLSARVGGLMRTREEVSDFSGVCARAQPLPIGVVIAGIA